MENVEIIRSRRKTLCIEIRQEQVLVRAPLRVSNAEITRFLQEKQSWIESHLAKARAREEAKQHVPLLTDAEIRLLAHEAKALIPDRVAYYARRLNVAYGRITIRCQDSVIVHELCHRKHMNHSAAFYDEVLRILPDYRTWDKWLKKNGPMLMARLGA